MGFKPPAGSAGSSGLTPTALKTANYSASAGDLVPVDASGGSVTVTLPTAPADKTQVAVKAIAISGTNTVTIARGGSDVFNKVAGSTSLTLSGLNQAALLQYQASTAIWYVVSADVPLSNAALAAAGAATVEEVGVLMLPFSGSMSSTTTVPLGYAPFPLRVVQFGISYYGTAVTASDTDYWSVALTKRSAIGSVVTPVATKTSKTIASGGEAFAFHVPWVFDAVQFDAAGQVFNSRDMIEVAYTKVGAPTAVSNMVHVVRFEPV